MQACKAMTTYENFWKSPDLVHSAAQDNKQNQTLQAEAVGSQPED